MSGKREKLDIDNTNDATHVYVKIENPQSLCPRFEGPYEIYSRPSRSQVELKIGMFKDGRPRLLTFHWSSCKLAHLREGAEAASRPSLGRRPKATEINSEQLPRPTPSSSTCQTGPPIEPATSSDPKVNKETTAKIQTDLTLRTRPIRSTRNSSPVYT